MDNWGFVFLAYGIVWAAILSYAARIKRKIRHLEIEIQVIESELGEPKVE
jgi:CcmD family protein